MSAHASHPRADRQRPGSIRSFARRALAGVLLGAAAWAAHSQTMVRLHTVLGPVDIELYDTGAPKTVANFLGYVRNRAYDGSFLHRSVPGFVVQGGGYSWNGSGAAKIAAGPAVVNEYSPTRSNVRGTVAMAKLGGNPDSATTEWFFNLGDNSANLNVQNGGFTVFGQVTAGSMPTVDAIARLPVVNAGGAFSTLPVMSALPSGNFSWPDYLVTVKVVSELPPKASLSEAERIFNYLEAAYPQYASTADGQRPTQSFDGYVYRQYGQAYAGVKDGKVYYLVPRLNPAVQFLANVADLLALAAQAGY